jgi:glucose 1-dehydrogenase
MMQHEQRLAGKTALVTGGGAGIGRAIALRLAREGADVAINYGRNAEPAHEVAQHIRAMGRRTLVYGADVSDEGAVTGMFAALLDAWRRLDILVNNAGIQKPSPSHRASVEDFDRVMAVNVRGPFLCSRAAIQHFLDRGGGGVILMNSSVHEAIPKPHYASYSASKGALENLTRTLALEYAGDGIRVNAVGPGATVTPINRAWTDDPTARREVEAHIPMGRAADADEIAAAFAFLASNDAAYVTGQTLFVCGGLTLYPEFRRAWSSGE